MQFSSVLNLVLCLVLAASAIAEWAAMEASLRDLDGELDHVWSVETRLTRRD